MFSFAEDTGPYYEGDRRDRPVVERTHSVSRGKKANPQSYTALSWHSEALAHSLTHSPACGVL